MNRKLLKFSLVCVTGTLILTANPKIAFAYEEAVAGFTYDKMSDSSQDNSDSSKVVTLGSEDIPMPGFNNVGIADVDTNLLIRAEAGENAKILGKIPKNGGVDIVESNKKGWTKIKAKTTSGGTISGYVKSEYLIIGDKASNLAQKVGSYVATANVNGLRVREKPNVDSDVLDQIAEEEELIVLDAKVITYGEEHIQWVKVALDGDDGKDGSVGYVAKEYVNLSYELKKAASLEEIQYGSGVTSKRINLINFAKKFLGDAYVWGGTRLGNGVDCSGYTQAIYREFGYYIPRVSRDQARNGSKVSSSNLKPGDLVFYGNSSSGYINHVAIYIGSGKIIHASNPRDGIKISNLYYRQPVKCVRYISD